jgi:bifunctional DNA-binding transcriptional regulator/antitoxin component of YhaV-PrlF toxin-antitoxin module
VAIERIRPDGQVPLPGDVRKAAGLEPGDPVTFKVTGEGKVEIQALPKLALRDLVERFPIEGDWDEDFARQRWQDDAAKECIEKLEP